MCKGVAVGVGCLVHANSDQQKNKVAKQACMCRKPDAAASADVVETGLANARVTQRFKLNSKVALVTGKPSHLASCLGQFRALQVKTWCMLHVTCARPNADNDDMAL